MVASYVSGAHAVSLTIMTAFTPDKEFFNKLVFDEKLEASRAAQTPLDSVPN